MWGVEQWKGRKSMHNKMLLVVVIIDAALIHALEVAWMRIREIDLAVEVVVREEDGIELTWIDLALNIHRHIGPQRSNRIRD
jgi:hypothetical protein